MSLMRLSAISLFFAVLLGQMNAQDTAYNAANFDGSSGTYISVASTDTLNIRDSLTVEAWINTPGTGSNNQGIVGKFSWSTGNDRQYMLRLINNNSISFNVSIDGQSGTDHEYSINSGGGSISANQWYHIAGVVADSMIYLYIDGT